VPLLVGCRSRRDWEHTGSLVGRHYTSETLAIIRRSPTVPGL